jgi:hypothetical protein
MLALVGTNQTMVQVIAQAERVKLAGDGASFAASQKTITDHMISAALGKDCNTFNILTKESVCAGTSSVIAIAANDSLKADTPGQIAALDSSIKAAAAGEPTMEAARNVEPIIGASFDMRSNGDTSSRIALLDSNIKSATANAAQGGNNAAPVLAAESPDKPNVEVVSVPGTNLVRKADPQPDESNSNPKGGAPVIASAQTAQPKESASPAAAPEVPPHDEPNAAQPRTVAQPVRPSLVLSREAASG